MILIICSIHCLQNDSNIASLDRFCHLHVFSHHVLHQFGFIHSWTNDRISGWQTIIIIARKYQMSWNFGTKNCSQRSCGVKESGIFASFPTAKREVLVECTGSRGLQMDCLPHSLGRIKNSLVPGSPSSDFKAGMVDCEALKTMKLISFPRMDQQSLCSYFHLQHPGSALWTWGDLWWSQDFMVLRQPNSQHCPLLSQRHHSRDPWPRGLETQGGPKVSKGKQSMPGLWRAGLGRHTCLGLSSFL